MTHFPLSLGISPCPNDTFIFDALIHGKTPSPAPIAPVIRDVEELNALVLARSIDVCKVSFAVLLHCADDYLILRSGAALGRGCGPLVIMRAGEKKPAFEKARIAIPGVHTTAALLLKLFAPEVRETVTMHFADIAPAVAKGDVDLGVIIHETRFTYESLGLTCVQDLGAWWERETGLPIPLGGIVARRSLGEGLICGFEEAIRQSLRYAWGHPEESHSFIRAHAQEIDEAVIRRHIGLYVNPFTLDIGEEGAKALERLFEKAQALVLSPGIMCPGGLARILHD